AALWASYLENETVFSGDDGVFEPAAPTRRFGFDLEVRAQPLSWLSLECDLAQASAQTDGGALALAPRLYLTGGLTVNHPVGILGGLRVRYLAERPAFDESSDEYRALNPTEPGRVNAQGYILVDLYAAYRYRWFEVGLSIQNLLNS